MIIFLHGEDSYRLTENKEGVIKSFREKHGAFNVVRVAGGDFSGVTTVDEACKGLSFFGEKKLVVVNDIFANAVNAQGIADLLQRYEIAADPNVIILATHPTAPAAAKPKEFFDLLADSKNLVREFQVLNGVQLQNWLKKEAAARGSTFERGAMERFIAVGGNDSWSRITNLEKLANYTRGPISVAAIDLLIRHEIEPNIFEFIDTLGAKRRDQAFGLLAAELAHGRDPYYLLTMVIYQFRNMLMVKDCADRNMAAPEIAKKAGVNPFVVKKIISTVGKYSLADIKNLYERVLRLEQGTKQGLHDLEDGLYSLALS